MRRIRKFSITTLTIIGINLILLPPAIRRAEAQIHVGYVNSPSALDFQGSASPIARFVQDLTNNSLLRLSNTSKNGYKLRMATALKVETGDELTISLRLDSSLRCPNGMEVTKDLVVRSLKSCRALEGVGIKFPNKGSNTKDLWISLSFAPKRDLWAYFSELEECSIIPTKQVDLFGDTLGKGSNHIGCGRYLVGSIKESGEIHLIPASQYTTDETEIVLHRYPSPAASLSALREGKVDAVLDLDEGTRTKVLTDETLSLLECRGFPVAYRKTLSLKCDPDFEL